MDQATERRYRAVGEEGGDNIRNTNINFSFGYQTKVGLDVVTQPPSPNVANFCVPHPSPDGKSMTTDILSKALPRPITLADQNIPPPPKEYYLLDTVHSRGGPLAPHTPTSAHPTHPGDGETYEHTDGAPMRRELLRSDPQPHAFPPRGEPLAKFGPTAAHPMYPGGGDIYSPTGRAPDRREASRIPTHLHNPPPRGGPLAKFGTAAAQPTHPGGGEIYPPTGWAPERR